MEWKDPEKEVSIYMTIKCTEIRFEPGTEFKFYCFCYGRGETFRFLKKYIINYFVPNLCF